MSHSFVVNILAQALYELFSAPDGKCRYFLMNITELQIFSTGRELNFQKLVIRSNRNVS